MNQARQNADLLEDIVVLVKSRGPEFEIKDSGEEEGAAEVVDELSDLGGPDGNEALVAAVLAVLLLEEDGGDAAGLALLGGDVGSGLGPGDRHDCLVVLWVRFGEIGFQGFAAV